MNPWRAAALLLIVNAVLLVAGVLRAGSVFEIEGPAWVPPWWLRSGFLVAIAIGLWFGARWIWWIAVGTCGMLALWSALALPLLVAGGYLIAEGAGGRALHFGLSLATALGALALLLSRRGRGVRRERAAG